MYKFSVVKIKLIFALLINLFLIACGGLPPKNGEVVYARIVTIYSEERFKQAQTDRDSFKGFFGKRTLAMFDAAVREGLTVEDIKNGRLVAVDCSCGAGCYQELPLTLPEGVNPVIYSDLLKVQIGRNDWVSPEITYRFATAKFLKKIDIPSENWVRYQGNHERMPVCFPDEWKPYLNYKSRPPLL